MRLMTVWVIRSSSTTRIFFTVGTGALEDWSLSFDTFSPRLSAPACLDVSFIRHRVIKPNAHQGNQITRPATHEKLAHCAIFASRRGLHRETRIRPGLQSQLPVSQPVEQVFNRPVGPFAREPVG